MEDKIGRGAGFLVWSVITSCNMAALWRTSTTPRNGAAARQCLRTQLLHNSCLRITKYSLLHADFAWKVPGEGAQHVSIDIWRHWQNRHYTLEKRNLIVHKYQGTVLISLPQKYGSSLSSLKPWHRLQTYQIETTWTFGPFSGLFTQMVNFPQSHIRFWCFVTSVCKVHSETAVIVSFADVVCLLKKMSCLQAMSSWVTKIGGVVDWCSQDDGLQVAQLQEHWARVWQQWKCQPKPWPQWRPRRLQPLQLPPGDDAVEAAM